MYSYLLCYYDNYWLRGDERCDGWGPARWKKPRGEDKTPMMSVLCCGDQRTEQTLGLFSLYATDRRRSRGWVVTRDRALHGLQRGRDLPRQNGCCQSCKSKCPIVRFLEGRPSTNGTQRVTALCTQSKIAGRNVVTKSGYKRCGPSSDNRAATSSLKLQIQVNPM